MGYKVIQNLHRKLLNLGILINLGIWLEGKLIYLRLVGKLILDHIDFW